MKGPFLRALQPSHPTGKLWLEAAGDGDLDLDLDIGRKSPGGAGLGQPPAGPWGRKQGLSRLGWEMPEGQKLGLQGVGAAHLRQILEN